MPTKEYKYEFFSHFYDYLNLYIKYIQMLHFTHHTTIFPVNFNLILLSSGHSAVLVKNNRPFTNSK